MKPTYTLKRAVVLTRASLTPSLPPLSDTPFSSHWLDRETRRAVNVIINNQHGFDIFTDGHWKLTGSGIEDVMKSKRPWELHTADASVVLISKSPNWMEDGIVTIRIEHGELLHVHSPYQMELLDIMAGLQLQRKPDVSTTLWSDCLAAVKLVNRLNKDISKQGNDPNLPLLHSCYKSMENHPDRKIIWCKAHPDIGRRSTWTKQEWGNHIADLVANGDDPSRGTDIHINHHRQIKATTVVSECVETYYWGTPMAYLYLLVLYRKHNITVTTT